MKIDVCFSPVSYPVYHNPEAIVVVVDVFRATTTMAAALVMELVAFARSQLSKRPRHIRQKAGWSERNGM
ncbi:MAG: 2-phosphosulfolactate phosphatase [Parabacteroides johnsonii]